MVPGAPAWSFTVPAPPSPGKVTLVSPSGTIGTSTPAYTWNADPLSTWYYLYVNDSTGNKIKTWYSAMQAGCSGGTGTCSVSPGTVLAPGSGIWWIQTYGSNGSGPWSDGMAFTVPGPALPGKATLVSPSGTISTTTPGYTWNAVSNSTWYYLWVRDSTGDRVIQWYSAAQAGCGSGTGTCSVSPGTALAGGSAEWWVQTWNAAGYGPWSNGMVFTVGGQPIQPPTLYSPAYGSTQYQDTIYFSWSTSSGANNYHLQIAHDTNFTNLMVNAGLGNTTSDSETGLFEYGCTYYWRVRAGNGSTWSGWSEVWWFK